MLDLSKFETRPHVAHLLGVAMATLMGAHIDDDDLAARSECTVHLREDAGRVDDVVQDEGEHRDIELAVCNREAFEISLPQVDVGAALQPQPGSREHLFGSIDTDDLANEGGKHLGERTGARAQVSNYRVGVQETEQWGERCGGAEQLHAEVVPPSCSICEEGRRSEPPDVQDGAGALGVNRIDAVSRDLAPDERPELFRRAIQGRGDAVVTAATLRARLQPPCGRERLKVATDVGLGHLKHCAELRNRELALLQQRENTRARFVAERTQVVRDRIRSCMHVFGYKHM